MEDRRLGALDDLVLTAPEQQLAEDLGERPRLLITGAHVEWYVGHGQLRRWRGNGGAARETMRAATAVTAEAGRKARRVEPLPVRSLIVLHTLNHWLPDKEDYLKRLRRIEGQVRGLQRMTEEEYCIDILTQVSAATRALQSVALGLMEDHLGHCVAQATAEGGDVAAAKVQQASDAIARLVRS